MKHPPCKQKKVPEEPRPELPVLEADGSQVQARCDLRAYTVHSDSIRVWMGGLSRFTVHSPQGARVGFKDTWVMAE